ncbi:MAG: hypothetical protein KJO38_06110, partial [Gammaproteobacteria bacterium]|nr:hypothetical protein [Gammaproteobacteria bacterium]
MKKYIASILALWPALGVAVDATAADDAVDIGTPYRVLKSLEPGDQFDGIRFLGALKLKRTEINGYSPRQLSGLAWDRDEARLYAV